MIEENSLYMKDRYRVEYHYNNSCGSMTFNNLEEAFEFAEDIGGTITINMED